MTNSEKLAWERQRAKGRDQFLLRTIMRDGVAFGVGMTACRIFWSLCRHQPLDPIWCICVQFAAYTLGFGAIMGWQAWNSKETENNKETAADEA